MDDSLLDPGDTVTAQGPRDAAPHRRTAPRRARRAELRREVEGDARRVAHPRGVEVASGEPRRASDVAVLWFRGERASVLRTVGGWRPTAPVEVRIAHAGMLGVRYELALYVVPCATGSRTAAA
ncbi:MAG: hypothetical protein U5K81_03720 [Trueperaceae bacterium]|nr:hypothetical protein [Trueperaceae bacterium]